MVTFRCNFRYGFIIYGEMDTILMRKWFLASVVSCNLGLHHHHFLCGLCWTRKSSKVLTKTKSLLSPTKTKEFRVCFIQKIPAIRQTCSYFWTLLSASNIIFAVSSIQKWSDGEMEMTIMQFNVFSSYRFKDSLLKPTVNVGKIFT